MTATSIGALLGYGEKTYSRFKVWKGSTTRDDIKTIPISRRDRNQMRHAARAFERQTYGTHQSRYKKGVVSRRAGKLGRACVDTYEALLDFLNCKTGRCDPSTESLARQAGVSVRHVFRCLKILEEAGMVNRLKRAVKDTADDGSFLLRQISSLYGILPVTSWRGYRPATPPAPDPDTVGAHPPMRGSDAFEAGGAKALNTFLEWDSDPNSQALARLGRRLFP